jgi:maleamate amidohydrolase
MGDTDVYKRQKLGQTISIGQSPALLIVDFVNGFLDPEMFGGGNVLEAAHNTKPVLELFRKTGTPVVFTRIVYADDGSNCGVWCEKAPRLKELTELSISSQVTDSLAPQKGEIIIRKTQASAFFDTALASILRHRLVDTLVFAGATTSGCVRASVVDAMSLNFRPLVLSDCVGDRALGPHDANLFDMGQKYANIAASTELGSIFSVFQ